MVLPSLVGDEEKGGEEEVEKDKKGNEEGK